MSDTCIFCSSCYTQNKPDSKFCMKCGAKLEIEFTSSYAVEEKISTTYVPPEEPEIKSTVFEPAEETNPKAIAFEPVSDAKKAPSPAEENRSPAFAPVFTAKEDEEEKKSILAEGLPNWSLEPPIIAIRRK